MSKINGKYLKDLREERGYSLRAFADMIYVSKSSVQRWEQSFVPENTNILKSIAEVFDISVEEMRKQSNIKYGTENQSNGATNEVAASKVTDNADMPATDRPKAAHPQNQFTELSHTAKCIAITSAIFFILSLMVVLWSTI